ncbi:hypothetical protein BJX65DRAFT_47959 [Aspergillus insuetus]
MRTIADMVFPLCCLLQAGSMAVTFGWNASTLYQSWPQREVEQHPVVSTGKQHVHSVQSYAKDESMLILCSVRANIYSTRPGPQSQCDSLGLLAHALLNIIRASSARSKLRNSNYVKV